MNKKGDSAKADPKKLDKSSMNSNKGSKRMLKVRSSKTSFNARRLNRVESTPFDDPNETFDYFYKIIVIGDENVGKSNLLRRIVSGKFEESPKTTYGVEFDMKTVPLPGTAQRVRAQIWDTSGAK